MLLKGSHSVAKEAREFSHGTDLDLETEFDAEMKTWKILESWKKLPSKWERKLSTEIPGLRWRRKYLLLPKKIRGSSVELFRLIFFITGLNLDVDSVIQAPRLLTTSYQGAHSYLMGIQIVTIVSDNIDTGKSSTIMISKHPANGMSINLYLLRIPQR